MAASYHSHGMGHRATFELSVRSMPPGRSFLVCAGLEDAVAYLCSLRFTPGHLDYLRTLGLFRDDFLEALGALRFTGDVHAVAEGEVVFAGEPLLLVTAPLMEAQIVETYLLNALSHQTAIASKAARVVLAADGIPVVHFSGRRDQGTDAAVRAARCAWIAGVTATSNVLAGKRYGIPVAGTMAHSYVMSFPDERSAFEAYARDFPDTCVLLVDTYDLEQGTRLAAEVGRKLAGEGHRLRAVRIDSGDLASAARLVRRILDESGLPEVGVFASGDLNEYRIRDLVAAGAPITGFGVGTDLGTSSDAPFLGAVYKLVDDEHGGKVKRSPGKGTVPGVKQVWRQDGGDVVGLAGESPGGRPLLSEVVRGGRRVDRAPALGEIRERATRSVAGLPGPLKEIRDPGMAAEQWQVELTPALRELWENVSPRG